ncbi:hypothetical protein [Ferrovum myxofaciens]|uniref:hypothetical protein n=1 Tax=Ferrovum myxofaciens TaxID=416213 RepID=UPI003EB71269
MKFGVYRQLPPFARNREAAPVLAFRRGTKKAGERSGLGEVVVLRRHHETVYGGYGGKS